MLNKYMYNESMYNYEMMFENILYSYVDEVNSNLQVYFKYNCSINSTVDNPDCSGSGGGMGLVLISTVDSPSGNLVFNYKYRFDINAEIDDVLASLEAEPESSTLDLTQNEVMYVISGANTKFGTPSNSTRSLGGLCSYNRIESFLPLRLFPLEFLELHFVSGNHNNEMLEINLEINDENSNYTVQYKDQDSTGFGPQVIVNFNEELKLVNEDDTKYIYIKLNDAPTVEKSEPVQLKTIYNNELILEEFDKNNPEYIYSSFFIINCTEHILEDIKIFTKDNEKVKTEIAVEIPVGHEIQTIANINTSPIVDDWFYATDTSSADILIPEIYPGQLYGVWTKNSLILDTSSIVSPWEDIQINIEYTKDSSSYTDNIKTLTRIYDNNLIGKLKVYYNINDTIDASGVVTEILDSTGDLPFEIADTSSLVDGDLIYFDIVRLNKYGIESIKKVDNYSIYVSDVSGGVTLGAPLAPQNGSMIYNSNSGMVVSAQYFPENEPSIYNRAYYWDVELYQIDDSTGNQLISDESEMRVQTPSISSNLENLTYIIDSTSISLLDGTPMIFKLYTRNESVRSLSSYDITTNYFNRDSILPPASVNIMYGKNYGINKAFLNNHNETIAINSDIDYIIEDNKILLKYLDEAVIKVVYRGETNIKNIMYLRSDYSIVEDDSLFVSATTTDIFDNFEVEDNILYVLVNLKRCLAIDFTNKIMYVKTIEHESDINLNDKYKNEYLFKRYDDTILNIFNNTTQTFKPFFHIDDEGNCLNKFKFINSKYNIEETI